MRWQPDDQIPELQKEQVVLPAAKGRVSAIVLWLFVFIESNVDRSANNARFPSQGGHDVTIILFELTHTVRNDHTTVTAPLPVCSAKLSTVGPG